MNIFDINPDKKRKLKETVSSIGKGIGQQARKTYNSWEEEEKYKAKLRKKYRRQQIARDIKAEYSGKKKKQYELGMGPI